MGTLNFVDLAGSERLSRTKAVGVRQEEGKSINKSLLFLGVVIQRLSEGKHAFIPFRDSKLTRILQSSLGGNSRTVIICNASPALSNCEHTVSTCRFGNRAVKVKNAPRENEVDQESALINQHASKIKELRSRLSELEMNGGNANGQAGIDSMDEELAEQHREEHRKRQAEVENMKRTLELKLNHLTNLVLVSTSHMSTIDEGQGVLPRRLSASEIKRRRATTAFGKSGEPLIYIDSVEVKPQQQQSSCGELRKQSNSGLVDEVDDSFYRLEQLRQKNAKLQALTDELSSENEDLLDQVSEHLKQQEEYQDRVCQLQGELGAQEQRIGSLQGRIDQFVSGHGLESGWTVMASSTWKPC